MSGARRHQDNLLLIAATAILILTAQRYFQASTPATRFAGSRGRARPSALPGRARQPATP